MSFGTATISATPGRATVGQAVRLTITVHDQAGALVDPGTCTLNLLLPDGTTSPILIGGLTHDSTGLFHYDQLGTFAGETQATVVTTVPSATASTRFVADPASTGRFNSGYVTVAEFKAMPTRLAVDELTVGAAARMQDAALAAILARSSAWADTFCQAPLGAQPATLLRQVKTSIEGDAHIPSGTGPKIPVQVTSVAWGGLRTALSALSDLTATFADRGLITIGIGSWSGTWEGALQFGSPPPGAKIWVSLGLITGWPNTILAADANAGDTTVTVANPAGIAAGTVLQATNPGAEETVTVLTAAGPVLTLTAGLANAQTAGCGLTAIPADVREAVAYAACARITTPGGQAANPNPQASSKTKAAKAEDLSYQGQAECLLEPYRRRLP